MRIQLLAPSTGRAFEISCQIKKQYGRTLSDQVQRSRDNTTHQSAASSCVAKQFAKLLETDIRLRSYCPCLKEYLTAPCRVVNYVFVSR